MDDSKVFGTGAALDDTVKTCCFNKCAKTQKPDPVDDKKPKGICGKACGFLCGNIFCQRMCAPCGYKFKKKSDKITCCLFVSMVIALLVAVIVPLIIQMEIENGIKESVVIDGSSASAFDTWHTNIAGEGDDVDVYFDIYFFDIQNAAGILNGEKPVVLERGPYSYSEYFQKFDIDWSDGGDTVTFNIQKYYVFNPATSAPGLSESDNLTVSYATALAFEYILGHIPIEVNNFLDGLINQTLYPIEQALLLAAEDLRGPAKQLVLDIEEGIEQLQSDLEHFIDEAPPGMGAMKILLCDAGPNGPTPFWVTQPQSAYFGWLNDPILTAIGKIIALTDNTTYWTTAVPGAYINYTTVDDARRRRTPDTTKTGKKNLKELNRFVRWGNRTTNWVCIVPADSPQSPDFVEGEMFPACSQFQNDWTDEQAELYGYKKPWSSDYANRIEGTDGQIHGAPVDTDKIQIFSSDIYRSAYFPVIETDITNWHNIKLRRYTFNPNDNLNTETRPTQWQWNQFTYNGLTNMTFEGAPVFGSMPHFLYGDPLLLEAVEGVTPGVPDHHETQLDVEPHTGLLAQVHKRIQMNYYINETVLPNMTASAIQNAKQLCEDIMLLPNMSDSNFTCEEWTSLFSCMAVPTHWNIAGGGVYLPYAWLDEHAVMPKRYADDIQTGIYDNKALADSVQTWGFVSAGQTLYDKSNAHPEFMCMTLGVLFAMLVGFLYSQRVREDEAKALQNELAQGGTTEPLIRGKSDSQSTREHVSSSNRPTEAISWNQNAVDVKNEMLNNKV